MRISNATIVAAMLWGCGAGTDPDPAGNATSAGSSDDASGTTGPGDADPRPAGESSEGGADPTTGAADTTGDASTGDCEDRGGTAASCDGGTTGDAEPVLDCEHPAFDTGGQRIVITDQSGGGRIRLMRTEVADWNDPQAQQWQFVPSGAPAGSWGHPDDVKLRRLDEVYQFAVCDSYGYVGLHRDDAPTFTRLWSTTLPGDNPHSVEILPNGNVGVAASTGGFVRIYAASQGPNTGTHAHFELAGAHGIHYDPDLDVLWALGDHELVELSVGGSDAEPSLSSIASYALPSNWGHDLSPVHGAPDRLFVTTGSATYWFDKAGGTFDAGYPYAAAIDGPGVKAQGNDAYCHTRTLQTRPQRGCATTWCTDTVHLWRSDGADETRTRDGAQIYKARFWTSVRQ